VIVKDFGSSVRVCVSENEVYNFKRRFPCSGLPDSRVSFDFDSRNGDLIDMWPMDMDGQGVLALSQDAREYAISRGFSL
jgi:hypothetical protein